MEEKMSKKAELERIFSQLLNAPELRSEVRGYLRHRLFTALHHSRLGHSLNQLPDSHPVSPKLQTLNLLIAEYLLKQRHHFTLSVFSCEAPNVSCISPNIPEMLKLRASEGSGSQIFSKEDICDITDTLGLPKDCAPIIKLSSKYLEGKDQAFITCLMRSLPDFFEHAINISTKSDDHTVKNQDTVDHQEIERIYQKQILSLTENFQTELHEKNEKIKELQLLLLDNSDTQEQNKRIETLTRNLKQMEIQFKNFEAAKHQEFLGLKQLNRSLENEMQELQGELETRKKHLRDEEFRVEREKLALKRNKKKLIKHQKQLDEVSIALTEHFPDQSKLPALEIQLQMKDQEISELRSRCQSLQEENKILQSLSTQQRGRIDSLNDKVSSLVGELHLARERALRARQTTSDVDSSPTDDVVKDARRRIRSLEEEFEAIEKQHKDYKNKSGSSLTLKISGLQTEQPPAVSPRHTPFTSSIATKSPRMIMVEEIQSSLKSLQESIKANPERLRQSKFDQSRLKILDISASSISSESTGIELKLRGEEKACSGVKTAFLKDLSESISPIPIIKSEVPLSPRHHIPEVDSATQLPLASVEKENQKTTFESDKQETSLAKISFQAEPLGTSEELKLTIPNATETVRRLEFSVIDSRIEGDGVVESSTSEDKSVPHVTGGVVDDDNFWDL
ncbi:Hypothetical predicted protein [Cloeon dipterum]|uniref:LisH domain-containing protein n=1 Tax=Cloeon dipterum TaxID=197152 RepID=A0A8S1CSS6_9INSE|nr:Hypothetical predicted protein [Cloeon dipterum]